MEGTANGLRRPKRVQIRSERNRQTGPITKERIVGRLRMKVTAAGFSMNF